VKPLFESPGSRKNETLINLRGKTFGIPAEKDRKMASCNPYPLSIRHTFLSNSLRIAGRRLGHTRGNELSRPVIHSGQIPSMPASRRLADVAVAGGGVMRLPRRAIKRISWRVLVQERGASGA
jgi:hypothetical protein